MFKDDLPTLQIRLTKDDHGYPLELTVTPSGEVYEGFYPPATPPPTDDGQALWAWLFADPQAQTAWNILRQRYPHCRIHLRIDTDIPELHAIPWETLTAEVMIAADAHTPFSRYSPSERGYQPPLPSQTLRMMAVIANPDGLPPELAPIDVAGERAIIEAAVSNFTAVELTVLTQPATLEEISATLAQGYHLLHIVAHGQINRRRNQAALLLSDNENRMVRVVDTALAEMIARTATPPMLIFLAACQSATRSTADAFHGLAPQLLQAGIPAVIAMQDAVQIETARAFTATFYQQLARCCYVDEAANLARQTLITKGLRGSTIPVLFSRLQNNRLLSAPLKPRQPFEPETVYIPSGPFIKGETGQTITIEQPYRIGKYPVTLVDYAAFLQDNPTYALPNEKNVWLNRKPINHGLMPVAGISYEEAVAYCDWLSEQTERTYRLPTEMEWEKAARGTDGRPYPWGDTWQADYCNGASEATTAVNAYPQGVSPYGCFDMVGNVRELTATWVSDTDVVLRGGSYKNDSDKLNCFSQHTAKTTSRFSRHGFRVVLEIQT